MSNPATGDSKVIRPSSSSLSYSTFGRYLVFFSVSILLLVSTAAFTTALMQTMTTSDINTYSKVDVASIDGNNKDIDAVPVTSSTSGSMTGATTPVQQTPRNIHIVVLVHGLWGNPNELLYLEQTLMKKQQSSDVGTDQMNSNSNTNDNTLRDGRSKWIVHSALSNKGSTGDGIVAGGHRLAMEVNELIKQVKDDYKNRHDDETVITFSIVGNSLGGLYARYAISEIDLNGIVPAVFCTLATPHLGVSENTYVKIPRFMESAVASVLQQTGSDLFRINSILDEMTTLPKYIQPLQQFHHRRAYANAHNTDFQVPFRTAAFISDTDSIHHYRHTVLNITETSKKFVSLIVETDKQEQNGDNDGVCAANDQVGTETECSNNDDKNKLTLNQMAVRLDSLGWTKIFCDMRDNLLSVPKHPITKLLSRTALLSSGNDSTTSKDSRTVASSSSRTFPKRQTSSSELETEKMSSENSDDGIQNPQQQQETIVDLNQPTSYTSAELLATYSTCDDRWHIPFGHSVLVANAKAEWYGKLNAGGRPMVEQIANDLIQHITVHA